MISDCFRYYRGCEECQRLRDLQLVPATLMHPIIKPWLFQGRGLDFIGQINPPLKNVTNREVIEFITEHIIHRSGIPQTLTTDQGSLFLSKEMRAFIDNRSRFFISIKGDVCIHRILQN